MSSADELKELKKQYFESQDRLIEQTRALRAECSRRAGNGWFTKLLRRLIEKNDRKNNK